MQPKRRESILWIEGIGFTLLILLSWLNEILRVPHIIFSEASTFNWGRVLLRTAVILCVWTMVHLATRRLLKRLHHLEGYLRICAWCRKLDHHGTWMTTEDFFQSAFSTNSSHGVCPACSDTLEKSADQAGHPVARKIRSGNARTQIE